jgi:5-methylcytosine-specific restriction endonuclease McrA
MICLNCFNDLVAHKNAGRPKKFCSSKCKDSYGYKIKKELKPSNKLKICPTCNNSFETNFSSPMRYCSTSCHPYQIALRNKQVFHPCKRCQTDVFVKRVYCDPCWKLTNSINNPPKIRQSEKSRKDRRLKLEAEALGLTANQRQRLLALWKSESQPCSYCFNLADTIDHIIPLSKNGTNFEDNLVPCCRYCNSSKSNKLISEWKGIHDGAKAK